MPADISVVRGKVNVLARHRRPGQGLVSPKWAHCPHRRRSSHRRQEVLPGQLVAMQHSGPRSDGPLAPERIGITAALEAAPRKPSSAPRYTQLFDYRPQLANQG